MSLLTVPEAYLDPGKVRPLGIMLAHGLDAEESWRAPLLEGLACALAAAGHVVMRYFCPLKEQRRHRIFEKAFDVAATSPYAHCIKRWAFVGFDNGARIAAGGEFWGQPCGVLSMAMLCCWLLWCGAVLLSACLYVRVSPG
jgi:predicted alpha/beta-hydrolase family hydrolase